MLGCPSVKAFTEPRPCSGVAIWIIRGSAFAQCSSIHVAHLVRFRSSFRIETVKFSFEYECFHHPWMNNRTRVISYRNLEWITNVNFWYTRNRNLFQRSSFWNSWYFYAEVHTTSQLQHSDTRHCLHPHYNCVTNTCTWFVWAIMWFHYQNCRVFTNQRFVWTHRE